jgi:RNA polymerase sigma-70 factor, ECF subfamily
MSDGGPSSGGNDREVFAVRPAGRSRPGLDELLPAVAVGDEQAYEAVYDQASGWVLGVVRKVLRSGAG